MNLGHSRDGSSYGLISTLYIIYISNFLKKMSGDNLVSKIKFIYVTLEKKLNYFFKINFCNN